MHGLNLVTLVYMDKGHVLPPVLEATDIFKDFAQPVLRGVDLSLRPGEVYALLGKNGAGKTTLLRIIAGLISPDQGDVRIFGLSSAKHPIEVRRRMAWLPDEPMVYDKLTPLEYLDFIAGLWGMPAADVDAHAERMLRWLDLWGRRADFCENFSRGMRQKVALAGALIHKPNLILMDEPMTGLDVASVRLVKEFFQEFTAKGGTILLTTHLLDVAERIADRIGVIDAGRLVAEGTLDQIRDTLPTQVATLEDAFSKITGGMS